MSETKILFSGLRGRTGRAALKVAELMPDVEITTGVTRRLTGAMDMNLGCKQWYNYDDLAGDYFSDFRRDFNVLVDFSNAECFNTILHFARRANVALIIGTSRLSEMQQQQLESAAKRIPIFQGGNFRFKVKRFIDEAVEYAKEHPDEDLTLVEKFYQGKSLPSDTSQVVKQRILEETGASIGLKCSATLPRQDLECHWEFGAARCDTKGFDEMAHDVLRIAKIMRGKPAGKIYHLDDIWEDVLEDAEMMA